MKTSPSGMSVEALIEINRQLIELNKQLLDMVKMSRLTPQGPPEGGDSFVPLRNAPGMR